MLLQFKPSHVVLPSSRENHLYFFYLFFLGGWGGGYPGPGAGVTEGHLKQNCSTVQTQINPKCLNIKPREHSG